MISTAATSARAELVRFVLGVFAVSLALGAVGLVPTRKVAGSEGVAAMIAAIAVVGVASLAGGIPVYLARRAAQPKPQMVLSSMVVRLLVVVALAVPAVLWFGVSARPFLAWLVIAYLALLVVDTLYAMRAMGSL